MYDGYDLNIEVKTTLDKWIQTTILDKQDNNVRVMHIWIII